MKHSIEKVVVLELDAEEFVNIVRIIRFASKATTSYSGEAEEIEELAKKAIEMLTPVHNEFYS